MFQQYVPIIGQKTLTSFVPINFKVMVLRVVYELSSRSMESMYDVIEWYARAKNNAILVGHCLALGIEKIK